MTDNVTTPQLKSRLDTLATLLEELGLPPATTGQILLVARGAVGANASPSVADWEIYSLNDALAPREPQPYVVSGLFRPESLSIVYGAPNTFKSFLLADMAVCVAAGQSWLPELHGQGMGRPITQGPVLYVDLDNGQRRTHERFAALARARGVSRDAPLRYVSMPKPCLDARADQAVDGLIRHIRDRDAKLVIVDNLGLVRGSADENSVEMARVMANFRRVAEETGAAVVLIHHERKSSHANSRAGEALRGHSSIEAAVDLALKVERAERQPRLTIHCTKSRDADVPDYAAMFTCEHKAGTDELKAAKFWEVPLEARADELVARQTIFEVVGNEPRITMTDLKKAVKRRLPWLGLNRIASIARAMAAEGLLVIEPGKRKTEYFSLPGEDQ